MVVSAHVESLDHSLHVPFSMELRFGWPFLHWRAGRLYMLGPALRAPALLRLSRAEIAAVGERTQASGLTAY